MADPPIRDHYDSIADGWAAAATTESRERVLWPTLAAFLGDVAGARVLDAGCGAGVHARRLAERGAEVIGADASAGMVLAARERAPGVEFAQADLRGLPFAADSFDAVLCQHVLSHLPDLSAPVDELARVLRPGGVLALSTHNPVHDFLTVREGEYPTTGSGAELELEPEVAFDGDPDYTATQRFDIYYGPRGESVPGTYYRRPVAALLGPILAAGFTLDAIEESTPDEAFRRDHPELVGDDGWPPPSICLRATR